MEVFPPLPDELTSTPRSSNTEGVISELCLKPPVNGVHVRVRVILKEKANDHSLLVLHPAVKNVDVQKCQHF
jgi:hypothetical protein